MTQPSAGQPGEDAFPLSLEQEWFYADRLMQPGYRKSIQLALDIHGPLDAGVFLKSAQLVFDRHPGLRVRLAFTGRGEPRQVIAPATGPAPVTCQAITGRSREQFDAYARRLAARELHSRCNPVRDPLCRLWLLRRADDEHVFLGVFDLLAFDPRAVRIFEHDLWQAYRSLCDSPSGEPPAGSDLAGAVTRQRDRHERQAMVNARYWAGRYALAPPAWQPSAARESPRVASARWETVQYTVGQGLAGKLKQASQAAGCTPYVMCVAAFASMAFQLTAQDRLALHVALDMRERDDENVIGMFTALRPLVIERASGGPRSFLPQVAGQMSQALEHCHLRGQAGLDLAGRPLSWWQVARVQSLLVEYSPDESSAPDAASLPGLDVSPIEYDAPPAGEASLALLVLDAGQNIRIGLCYDMAVVTGDLAASLPARLNAGFSQMAAAESGP